ncbi:Sel1-like repeat [Fusarium oxysporum f. sp. vasinfectum]|nr:Sel1-like repeat [Fusarium oxysporum f. sp. vasinfectum]
MGIRDILKKKDDLSTGQPPEKGTIDHLAAPEFTIIRSDTSTQERIYPPSMKSVDNLHLAVQEPKEKDKPRRSLDVFRSGRSRSASESSQTKKESGARRLSQRLHLSRAPPSSENVPENLPDIVTSDEAQWEKRATMLAGQNNRARSNSRPGTPSDSSRGEERAVSSQQIDQDIQEAIRLHEEGKLELSTRMFGRLADPQGANNPLSQVLYGLALRHGWGCAPDPEGAVKYLSAAASNSASIEQMALQAGMKKGGAAKGELVLAIFELANCFRHGWGIEKDAYAAKQYYETAANLGDTDAMNEIAWCYVEGFGCKKDKGTLGKSTGQNLRLHIVFQRYCGGLYFGRLSSTPPCSAATGPGATEGVLSIGLDPPSCIIRFDGQPLIQTSCIRIWKEKYDPPGDGNRK